MDCICLLHLSSVFFGLGSGGQSHFVLWKWPKFPKNGSQHVERLEHGRKDCQRTFSNPRNNTFLKNIQGFQMYSNV